MVEITLAELLAGIRERKALLGIVDTVERTEAMRNNGRRRSPEKRAMLARIDERARAQSIVDGVDDSDTDGSGVSPQNPVRRTYDLGALLDEMSPETYPEVVNFDKPAGNEN